MSYILSALVKGLTNPSPLHTPDLAVTAALDRERAQKEAEQHRLKENFLKVVGEVSPEFEPVLRLSPGSYGIDTWGWDGGFRIFHVDDQDTSILDVAYDPYDMAEEINLFEGAYLLGLTISLGLRREKGW